MAINWLGDASKFALSRGGDPDPPPNTRFPWPTRAHTADGRSIGSADFAGQGRGQQTDHATAVTAGRVLCGLVVVTRGGSVAEWLACWTQAQ